MDWSLPNVNLAGVQAGGSLGSDRITKKGAYKGTIVDSERITSKGGKDIIVLSVRCEENGEFKDLEIGIPLGADLSKKGNLKSWKTVLKNVLPASSHGMLEAGPVTITAKGILNKPIFFYVTADAQVGKNEDGTFAKDAAINVLLEEEYNAHHKTSGNGASATGFQAPAPQANAPAASAAPTPFSI